MGSVILHHKETEEICALGDKKALFLRLPSCPSLLSSSLCFAIRGSTKKLFVGCANSPIMKWQLQETYEGPCRSLSVAIETCVLCLSSDEWGGFNVSGRTWSTTNIAWPIFNPIGFVWPTTINSKLNKVKRHDNDGQNFSCTSTVLMSILLCFYAGVVVDKCLNHQLSWFPAEGLLTV